MATFFTTAPEAYYQFGTTGEATRFQQRGKPMFKVEIPAAHTEYQRARFASGLHGSYTESEMAELLEAGIVTEVVDETVDDYMPCECGGNDPACPRWVALAETL